MTIAKIYKVLSSPRIMVFSWIFFILTPLLGTLRLKILTDPNLKIFHISGFSTILFYTPLIISIFVLSIMLFWFREFSRGKLTNSHQKTFSLISILTLIFLFVSQYLINLEFKFYPNYLYGHYGITIAQLKLMSFVAALQIMIFLAFFVYRSAYTKTKKILKNNFPNSRSEGTFFDNASLLITTIGILSLFILSGSTFLNWNIYRSESKEGYEGKVGVDYKYIELIMNHTSKEAAIIHPPQGNKWPAIGNQPVLRYFLYPRILISGVLINDQKYLDQFGELYFVVIDPKGEREWPIINFSNKTIVFDEMSSVKYKNIQMTFSNDVSKIYKINFK